jgi:transcriptional regulator with XRE-family HTH domain
MTADRLAEARVRIASRLRLARETAGLTQGQVAKMLSLHRPTISEIEAGRRRVSAEELQGFAKIYNISAAWLIGTIGSKTPPGDDRILFAARQLSKLKDQDLARLIDVIRMLKHPKASG